MIARTARPLDVVVPRMKANSVSHVRSGAQSSQQQVHLPVVMTVGVLDLPTDVHCVGSVLLGRLFRILATCRSAVLMAMTRASAISRLVWPRAINVATSCSRGRRGSHPCPTPHHVPTDGDETGC